MGKLTKSDMATIVRSLAESAAGCSLIGVKRRREKIAYKLGMQVEYFRALAMYHGDQVDELEQRVAAIEKRLGKS